MSSYFSTIKRGGASSKKGSPPDDAALHELPPDEDQALSHLKEHAIPLMCKAKGICASSDAWMLLLENGRETERDEMLLRFLRYNGLNVEITVRQVGEVISWRTKVTISSMVVDVMYGKEAGIPIVQLGKITKQGDGLFFCAAELYEKKDVVRKTQEIGVIKMFEYLLYEMCIPRVKRVTAVIDFTGFGVKHIDLTALRMGISVYTNYYPDVFHRVFLVNYPKILYGGKFASLFCL